MLENLIKVSDGFRKWWQDNYAEKEEKRMEMQWEQVWEWGSRPNFQSSSGIDKLSDIVQII